MNTDLTPAPTPRTDAVALVHCHVVAAPLEFTRGLERELLAASKERDSAIEELVEAKQAWLDKADPDLGPYIPFETYNSVCRALREEQLKTQAFKLALREIRDKRDRWPAWSDQDLYDDSRDTAISALAGEQPTRP